ncbi:unnamed protein product [Rotaria sp. Silwood1]|nr:unnamed protein product [Rotaria sp. Silwood1]CAF3662307.1 unnamed protein product [Rotaria sp. Silwood1]CAF3705982.1 unnamed protein product [Rotaria sp. Silwood1]CAF4654717.1 unnamed protein product [Rotaria sp. Silwood1]CAF4844150.1 unnamed protein product [Rotaria sp. Silwood1]
MATATTNDRAKCFTCEKEKIVYLCGGCSKNFCLNDLTEHRKDLGKQFEGIENDRDQFYQKLVEQKQDQRRLPLMQQVDKWEEDSIKKIKQTAEDCRQTLIEYNNKHFIEIEKKLSQLTEQLKQSRQENEFNEIELDRFKTILTKLAEELGQPANIKIQQNSTSLINKLSVVVSSEISQENQFHEIDFNHFNIEASEDLFRSSRYPTPRVSSASYGKYDIIK